VSDFNCDDAVRSVIINLLSFGDKNASKECNV